jgi:hypothetical protein
MMSGRAYFRGMGGRQTRTATIKPSTNTGSQDESGWPMWPSAKSKIPPIANHLAMATPGCLPLRRLSGWLVRWRLETGLHEPAEGISAGCDAIAEPPVIDRCDQLGIGLKDHSFHTAMIADRAHKHQATHSI